MVLSKNVGLISGGTLRVLEEEIALSGERYINPYQVLYLV